VFVQVHVAAGRVFDTRLLSLVSFFSDVNLYPQTSKGQSSASGATAISLFHMQMLFF